MISVSLTDVIQYLSYAGAPALFLFFIIWANSRFATKSEVDALFPRSNGKRLVSRDELEGALVKQRTACIDVVDAKLEQILARLDRIERQMDNLLTKPIE